MAKEFDKTVNISSIILTRIDGDGRGGAALSMKHITNKPIKYIGVGEKIEDLELFHPERIANRILGMGDVVSLVEKASEGIDEEKLEDVQTESDSEINKLKDTLARTQADFVNFQQRTARDKNYMVFFLKADILKKILPRIDDLERMITNTPEEMRTGALYEGIISMQTKLLSDLDKMDVKPFDSKGEEVNISTDVQQK